MCRLNMKSTLTAVVTFLCVSIAIGILGLADWQNIAVYGGITFVCMLAVLLLKQK